METVYDEATVAARLAARAQRSDSPSDATLATYLQPRAAMTANPPPVPQDEVMIQVFAALVAAEVVRSVVPNAPVNESLENSRK